MIIYIRSVQILLVQYRNFYILLSVCVCACVCLSKCRPYKYQGVLHAYQVSDTHLCALGEPNPVSDTACSNGLYLWFIQLDKDHYESLPQPLTPSLSVLLTYSE